jgi:hypothetical protein
MKPKTKFLLKLLCWAILITVFTLSSSCVTVEPPRSIVVHTYHTHTEGSRYVSQHGSSPNLFGQYNHTNTRVCSQCGLRYYLRTQHFCGSEAHIYYGEAVFSKCSQCGCVYPAHFIRCRNCRPHHHRHRW